MEVLALVSGELGVSLEDILQPSRGTAGCAHARQLAMYLCNVVLTRRIAAVGRLFGRDHSTVSYACNRIEDLRDDPRFDDSVARLEDRLARVRDDVPDGEVIRAAR
jgi:chromosomal replication initiation ATPase DnaA